MTIYVRNVTTFYQSNWEIWAVQSKNNDNYLNPAQTKGIRRYLYIYNNNNNSNQPKKVIELYLKLNKYDVYEVDYAILNKDLDCGSG